MNYLKRLLATTCSLFLLLGCALSSEEIGRASLTELTTPDNIVADTIILPLKAGDEIGIWSDIDVEYEGDLTLKFRVFLSDDVKESSEPEIFDIDPFQKKVTIGESNISIGNKVKHSFLGRNQTFDVKYDANYKMDVVLLSNGNETLKINKADFVLKK